MSVHAVAAKINLALVVGERRIDGLHEVATVMQRIALYDRLTVATGDGLDVRGFAEDTLVRAALELLAAEAIEPLGLHITIEKGIPIAAGLGGGSADAAAALVLGNRQLASPLSQERLHVLARRLGSDVPFFLDPGPKLGLGAGEQLSPLELPQHYWVLIALPDGVAKLSTAAVYRRYDEAGGGPGFDERCSSLRATLRRCSTAKDLASLPPNDLAGASGVASFVRELRSFEPFRADVTGAGPAVYALFEERGAAVRAAAALRGRARTWVARALW